jgi:hypothetical protein
MDLVPKKKARLFESSRKELLNPLVGELKEPRFGDIEVLYDYVNKRWIVGVKK